MRGEAVLLLEVTCGRTAFPFRPLDQDPFLIGSGPDWVASWHQPQFPGPPAFPGGPPVAEPKTKGFGTRMLNRVLASDLGGRVDVEYRRGGLFCRIRARQWQPEASLPADQEPR